MNGYVLVPVWEHNAFWIMVIVGGAFALAMVIGLVWCLCQRDEDWNY